MCLPLQMQSDGTPGPTLTYIVQAKDIFKKWKASGNAGLTNETFLACIQTIESMIELASHIHKVHGFSYVLPGKFMSDPLEARFGWYRQVNGGNFFMSLKQLLEAEKKIRVLTVMQQKALLSAQRLQYLQGGVQEHSGRCDSDHKWLQEFLSERGVSTLEMEESDANVTFFVSGYISRSISRRRKCSACKEMLITQTDREIQISIPPEHKQLFEMADRGGLSSPSELCFAITALAFQSYNLICGDTVTKRRLLALNNACSVFVATLADIAESFDNHVLSQRCTNDHANFELIAQCSFNCFAKNELKRLNSSQDMPAKMSRTVRKLQSSSSK